MTVILLLSCCLHRAVRPITLRTGVEGVAKHPAALPSDKDPAFTYGKPAKHRWACSSFGDTGCIQLSSAAVSRKIK